MIKHLLPKSELSKSILTLITGTTIAQAIPILISPILTRLYSPKDFGLFALFLSISSIASVIATGRYELAIILPKKDTDAFNILALTILILSTTSLFILILVYFFNTHITTILGVQDISKWLYFLPLSIFIISFSQSFYYWLNRKKSYKPLAVKRILLSATTGFFQLILSFLSRSPGSLIISSLIGQSLSSIYLGWNIWRRDINLYKEISGFSINKVAKRYIEFPKFLVIAHSLNITTAHLPIILLTSFFGATNSGFFLLVQRVIMLPMSIIGASIGDVFRQKASVEFNTFGNCISIYKSTFIKLIILSFSIFPIFFFISSYLFSSIFGKEWAVAGTYAQLLTIMFFFQFISSPLSNMFIIAEKQKLDLIFQSTMVSLTGISLFAGYYFFNNPYFSILFYSISNSIIYFCNLILTYGFARGRIGGQ